ncbi:MAG: hypothetical protein IJL08_03790 [Oscillospiraceae bacterium]|nr:hypothetical protein [Oscillospiraceae bacterium]
MSRPENPNERPRQTEKPQFYSFESPFREGNAGDGREWDSFLEQFRDGIPEDKAGPQMFQPLKASAHKMIGPMENLFRQGLFGGMDAFPSVDEVVRDGKRILIVEPDGTVTNYSDKYLKNNPTVAKMRKLEAGRSTEGYGRVLLGHLGLFLGGKGKADLKNYEKAFGDVTPADPGSGGVFIDTPDGLLTLADSRTVDYANREKAMMDKAEQEYGKLQEDLDKKTAPLEAKKEELNRERERYERLAHPDLPPFPRESNPFRRFFTWIRLAPHSAQYNRELDRYNEIKRTRAPYEKKKKDYEEHLKAEQPELDRMEAEQKAAQEKADQEISRNNQAVETLRTDNEGTFKKVQQMTDLTNRVRKYKKQYDAEVRDFLTGEWNLRRKLGIERNMKRVTESEAVQFSKGSVGAMLDIINNRAIIDAEMKKDMPRLDAKNRQIWERSKKLSENNPNMTIQEEVNIDNTPYNDVNKLLTLTDYATAAKIAWEVERVYAKQAEEDERRGLPPKDYTADKQRSFDKLSAAHYETMVKSSKECFRDIFVLEPTVENVQTAINSLNLDRYVRQGIRQIDGMDYDPVKHKLPPVNEGNLDDMTLLLMSGIKTAALVPQKGPDIENGKNPNQSLLAQYRPGPKEPEVQQPEEPQAGGPQL